MADVVKDTQNCHNCTTFCTALPCKYVIKSVNLMTNNGNKVGTIFSITFNAEIEFLDASCKRSHSATPRCLAGRLL